MILNLPPHVRQNAKNILLQMLIPAHLKNQAARKYYDWAAKYEIRDLHVNGIDGICVEVYGTTLDSPGRAEMLCMQSHGAYYGCPHCEMMFSPGIFTKPVFGGFRCYLPRRSPWRQRTFVVHGSVYHFPDIETRQQPKIRTTQSALECVQLATTTRPFRGHKCAPFISRWPSFSWEMHSPDIMHDIKCVCDMTLTVLVGKGNHGKYANWTDLKDHQHREYCMVHDIFPEVHNPDNPLPWRLTPDEVNELDLRVRNIWWPHYLEKISSRDCSFWKKTSYCWKCSHKNLAFLVLEV